MAIAECKQTYVVGKRRVAAGTRAAIVRVTARPTASVTLEITETKEGSALRVGETFNVATSDLAKFWKTLP
jgi:hypothetical protein